MTYALSNDEIAKVRELVSILTGTDWNGGCLSPEEERRCIELGKEIAHFIS